MNDHVLTSVLERTTGRTPEEIIENPRFSIARSRLLRAATLSMAGDEDTRLRQLINSLGRAALFSVITGRYFRFAPDKRETWPTVKLVKERYLPLGFVRSRALDETLGRLCTLGLVTMNPHPLDARTRLVMPSLSLLEFDRAWLADQFSSIEVLYPGCAAGAALRLGDIRYQLALRHLASHTTAQTQVTLNRIGPVRDAILKQDGLRILTAYLLKADETGSRILNLPFSEVEQVISTSRTHVRHLFQTLEQLGLVHLHRPGGQRLELTEMLVEHIDRFLATILANYDVGWRAASWLVENEPSYAQYVPPAPATEMI